MSTFKCQFRRSLIAFVIVALFKCQFRRSLIAFAIVAAFAPPAMAAGQTTRVSVASDGTQTNDGFGTPNISADGRFVMFSAGDAFVHDRITKKTTRISVASDGTQGNDYSFATGISADGRFVAFTSNADNLVPGDSNGDVDAFVHNRLTGKTTIASIATNGTHGNSASFAGGISADGRFVLFQSLSNNLVNGDINPAFRISLCDLRHFCVPLEVLYNLLTSRGDCYV